MKPGKDLFLGEKGVKVKIPTRVIIYDFSLFKNENNLFGIF